MTQFCDKLREISSFEALVLRAGECVYFLFLYYVIDYRLIHESDCERVWASLLWFLPKPSTRHIKGVPEYSCNHAIRFPMIPWSTKQLPKQMSTICFEILLNNVFDWALKLQQSCPGASLEPSTDHQKMTPRPGSLNGDLSMWRVSSVKGVLQSHYIAIDGYEWLLVVIEWKFNGYQWQAQVINGW